MSRVFFVLCVCGFAWAGWAHAQPHFPYWGQAPFGYGQGGRAAIYLFPADEFRGEPLPLGGDWPPEIPDLRDYGIDDAIDSARVLSGLWEACEGSYFRGFCIYLDSDIRDLRDWDFDRRISSIRLFRPPRRAGLLLYEDEGFRGGARWFDGDVADLKDAGVNDEASSVRIRGGVWALCEDAFFGGDCVELDRDAPDLFRLGVEDRVSSIRRLDVARPRRPQDDRPFRGRPRVDDSRRADPFGQSRRALLVLFSDSRFRGRALELDGEAPDLADRRFNDVASSVRILKGAWAFCEDAYFGGRCVQGRAGQEIDFGALGFNDTVSSVKQLGSGQAARAGLVLFEHGRFSGAALEVTTEIANLDDKRFNDRTSSVRVITGEWRLCTDAYFGGRCVTIERDVDFSGAEFNDRISSVKRLD